MGCNSPVSLVVITAKMDASRNSLDGKQVDNDKVGAKINDEIKQNSGYAQVI